MTSNSEAIHLPDKRRNRKSKVKLYMSGNATTHPSGYGLGPPQLLGAGFQGVSENSPAGDLALAWTR
jgi:hypothetical protein